MTTRAGLPCACLEANQATGAPAVREANRRYSATDVLMPGGPGRLQLTDAPAPRQAVSRPAAWRLPPGSGQPGSAWLRAPRPTIAGRSLSPGRGRVRRPGRAVLEQDPPSRHPRLMPSRASARGALPELFQPAPAVVSHARELSKSDDAGGCRPDHAGLPAAGRRISREANHRPAPCSALRMRRRPGSGTCNIGSAWRGGRCPAARCKAWVTQLERG